MREHEDRNVVRRLVPPPSFPGLVLPGTADRAEHVTAQNPRPDVLEAPGREVVVDPGGPVAASEHPLKGAGRENPPVQRFPSHAKGVLEPLTGASAESVE
jgi:hypothetical protein